MEKKKSKVVITDCDHGFIDEEKEAFERLGAELVLAQVKEEDDLIQTVEMLRIFQQHRGDAIVIPGRGGRHWVKISTRPNLDAPLGDPAMGGHASFALGLALARPERKVVLFDSEGDLLLSLGILATIAEQKPANLYHFMLDNEWASLLHRSSVLISWRGAH